MDRRAVLALGVLLVVAGCATTGPSLTPSASATSTATPVSDPQRDRVQASLESERGMTFEPAGPHHLLGTAADGTQLDLVGVPVEEVVLSLPTRDRAAMVETGIAYLPKLRALLQGPSPFWNAVADALRCREDPAASCLETAGQANVTARFNDGGPGFIVLVVTRD
jgi:hypothetical protein